MKITQILDDGDLSKTYFYILLKHPELTNFDAYYNEMTQLLKKTIKEKQRVTPQILNDRKGRLASFENILKLFATLPEPADSEDLSLRAIINRRRKQYIQFANQRNKLDS